MRISDWSSDVCSSDLSAPVMLQHESHAGPCHGEAAHDILAGRIFRARRAQELAASGNLGEELLDPDARAGRQRGRTVRDDMAVIDHPRPAFTRIMRPALDSEPGHRSEDRKSTRLNSSH